ISILLLDHVIVGQHIHRELALPGIDLLQLQAHRSYWSWLLALGQRELIVVAVAPVLQELEVLTGVSNEAALHTQVTNRAVEPLLRSLKIVARSRDVAFRARQIGFYSPDRWIRTRAIADFRATGAQFPLPVC